MTDEFLNIVNEIDQVIGEETRARIHQLGLWHRGVHVFLFTPDGKLLVQKRSADRASSPSLLDCSVSEHVKAGESYLNAAIRGMKEELGVQGIQIRELVKFRMNYGINDNEISVLYEGIVDSASVRFDPVEIEEVSYYEVSTLREEMKSHSKKFCRWFLEIMKCYFNESANMVIFQDS